MVIVCVCSISSVHLVVYYYNGVNSRMSCYFGHHRMGKPKYITRDIHVMFIDSYDCIIDMRYQFSLCHGMCIPLFFEDLIDITNIECRLSLIYVVSFTVRNDNVEGLVPPIYRCQWFIYISYIYIYIYIYITHLPPPELAPTKRNMVVNRHGCCCCCGCRECYCW